MVGGRLGWVGEAEERGEREEEACKREISIKKSGNLVDAINSD